MRNLDPPNRRDISRLNRELQDLRVQSKLPPSSAECLRSIHEDDFVVIRGDVRKGKRLNVWARFFIDLVKWELWYWKKVSLSSYHPSFFCSYRSLNKLRVA